MTKIPGITPEQEILMNQGRLLPVMEHFYTLQGEGTFTGTAAYFLRIGGCDVGCQWCDVKESWDARKHPLTAIDPIIEQIGRTARTAVITGGEPLNWNMDYLTDRLHEKGIHTHLETSGSSPLSGTWDWICLSPKKQKPPLEDIYDKADELKVIIAREEDFHFAEGQARRVNKDCRLILQPEWSRSKQMMPLITDYVMKNPQWKVSLQAHKFMNIP